LIQLTPQMRILVAIEPVDFRKGIDGLARLCKDRLQADPYSGSVFVFRSRTGGSLRLLMFDGTGFWLCHKRLSQGRFRHWPQGQSGSAALLAHELQVLLYGGNPAATDALPPWRSVVMPN
jgi:transposase